MPRTTIHPYLGEVRYTATVIPDHGDEQTREVLKLMWGYALEDSKSAEVQDAVARARQQFPRSTPEDQVFYWVKRLMRFSEDIDTAGPLQYEYLDPIVEVLIRPRDVLLAPSPIGDCDDYSMLVASMLIAQGIPVRFVTVAADSQDPGQFSHVYVVSYRDGHRYPLDVSHGPRPGWEVSGVYRKKEWGPEDLQESPWVKIIAAGAVLAALFWDEVALAIGASK